MATENKIAAGIEYLDRRAAIAVGTRGVLAALLLIGGVRGAGAKDSDLAKRLESEAVQQMPADMGNQQDIEYPFWLEGTWQVTSVLEEFKAPLGNKFLGGSSSNINDRSAAEATAQKGKEISYMLRFEKLPDGKVREDRLFNQQQRLDAFANRNVVKKILYVAIDRGQKTRELNTLVYFAGGLVGKTFSTRRRFEVPDPQTFVAAENTRQLYARKCEQTVESKVCPPPISTDQEAVTLFTLTSAAPPPPKRCVLRLLLQTRRP